MNLIIVDKKDTWVENLSGQIVLWQGFNESGNPGIISIPDLVEKNSFALRRQYLKIIYDLANTTVRKKKLVDSLELRPGFSYWWMTLIAEKCNFAKSPIITEVIRFLAFDNWVKNIPEVTSIELISSNKELTYCFRKWCRQRNISFKLYRVSSGKKSTSLIKKCFDCLPGIVQSGIWLIGYLIDRWPLRGVGVEEWGKGQTQIAFVSYLFNLKSDVMKNNRFESEYWTNLPKILDEDKISSSWLHIFVKNSVVSDSKVAKDLLMRFNEKYKNQQVHVTLDSFLCFETVFGALWDYLFLVQVCLFNYPKFNGFEKDECRAIQAIIFPFLKTDWSRTFFGKEAMKNVLMLNLFERAFSALPSQNKGVYLQENQGWEFGMIHAWRANGHGRLFGFPHTTVRFWDLRYFFDHRSYGESVLGLPMPDSIAVSGDAVRSAYLAGGYPKQDLVDVEALRYLHLGNMRSKPSFSARNRGNVLVISDYVRSNVVRQMEMLRDISDDLGSIILTIKAHPACPIKPEDYPELQFELTDEPLSVLVNFFDTAYTGSLTGAAVDVYSSNMKVISVLAQDTLNLSPLRGIEDVCFVGSSFELRKALLEAVEDTDRQERRINYFNMDSTLPRWRQLLGSAC